LKVKEVGFRRALRWGPRLGANEGDHLRLSAAARPLAADGVICFDADSHSLLRAMPSDGADDMMLFF